MSQLIPLHVYVAPNKIRYQIYIYKNKDQIAEVMKVAKEVTDSSLVTFNTIE